MTAAASPPRFDTHVCLVSDQATPNLLPIFDEHWRPRRVVLAASPQMKARAGALDEVIRKRGVEVSHLALRNAYDYESLREDFAAFLERDESAVSALNVTGGTKLMAVAAQEMFGSAGRPAFYVSIETDQIVVIGERGHSAPLSARVKIGEYLSAHGYRLRCDERPRIHAAERDMAARLVDRVGDHGRQLGQLNWLAQQAKGSLSVTLTEMQDDSRAFGEVLALFEDAGRMVRQGRTVSFPDEASRRFVNGGWLELHVLQVLRDLQGSDGLGDMAVNLEIDHPNAATTNEIDAAFMFRNTLHLIECKTANLEQAGTTGDDKATEAIYRMESLQRLGGLRTRCMIVDYRGAFAASDANRKRAALSRIEVVSARELRDLKGQISRRWLRREG